MENSTKIKIIRFIMAFIVGGSGASLVYLHGNGWLVIGIILMLWSNNIERATFKD